MTSRSPFPPGTLAVHITSALRHEARLFLVALQFLTRIPVPAWVGFDAAWLNQCVRHFPLVGALVGASGAAVLLTAAAWWQPQVAVLITLGWTVWLTGAFHEDGLADTLDALGGQVPRERALAIMKDSRIGTYGAAALVLVLALRGAALADLLRDGASLAAAGLVLSHALGRMAAVLVMARLPYAGDPEHAKAKPLATSVPASCLVAALIWGVLILALCGSAGAGLRIPALAIAALACLLVGAAMVGWLRRRLGGYTGDTLGATEQLVETAVLLALVAR